MEIKKKTIEHVIEIRFKPNARILDKRGEITSNLSSILLNQWNISNNQIEFSNKDDSSVSAIFSFKNTIFTSGYPNDTKFFIENAEAFIKSAWTILPNSEITRVGVRTRSLLPAKDFKSIFESYKKNFLALNDEQLSKIGGTLIDLGFPLNFIDGENFFNIMTGPMEKEQINQFLKDKEEIYETAVFLDFDYFRKEFSPYTKQKDVIDFLKLGIKKADEALSAISELILK